VHRIVRRGLVGDGIGLHAAPEQLGQDFGGVAEQRRPNGSLLAAPCSIDARERVVEVLGLARRR
jgi:hypothetical protein